MTIDTNTVLMVALALTTVYFAYGFVRGLVQDKFDKVYTRIDEVEKEMWMANDRTSNRINDLARSCRATQPCPTEKNYYNSGAGNHL